MKIESDLSKLARWAIPGWLTILSFYLFVSTDIAFTPSYHKKLFDSVTDFLNSMLSIDEALLGILVAAAGIPIGFLIYQVYFFFRWNSPFSRDGFFFPLFQGRMSDLRRTKRDIADIELVLHKSVDDWRQRLISNPLYKRDHAFQWRYIELLFLEAAQKIDSKFQGLNIYGRQRYLHEVTHTLGVSIFALYLGFGAYLYLKITIFPDSLFFHPLFAITMFLGLFALLNLEEKAREKLDPDLNLDQDINNKPSISNSVDTLENEDDGLPIPTFTINYKIGESENQILIVSPSLVFIFAFLVFHLFGNPILNPSVSFINIASRLVLFSVFAIIWMTSKRTRNKSIHQGDFVELSIVLFLAIVTIIFHEKIIRSLDWGFQTTTMQFLIIILILVQNRQNAREEKCALEYYILRRYLTDRET